MAVIQDCFNFELLFTPYEIRWGPRVVGSVLIGLAIRSQQTGMEDVINGPGRRQLEPIGYW
jgi:hypothetical protein